MTRYYGANGKPLGCSGYYRKGDKFRMSPHCYGCHIKIQWMIIPDEYKLYPDNASQIVVPELQHPDFIRKDGQPHLCWMPCISPHYEMVYVEEGIECQSIS